MMLELEPEFSEGNLPEASVKLQISDSTASHSWRWLCSLYLAEGFSDVCFHLPVHRPPHFETVVVGLGCDVLAHWIPRQTLHQPRVSSQTRHHLWRGDTVMDDELTRQETHLKISSLEVEFAFSPSHVQFSHLETCGRSRWRWCCRRYRRLATRHVATRPRPSHLQRRQNQNSLIVLRQVSVVETDELTAVQHAAYDLGQHNGAFSHHRDTLFALPPVWFLRMVTHRHCSTFASLLLDPKTVLGPMNLQRKYTNTHSHNQADHQLSLVKRGTEQTLNISTFMELKMLDLFWTCAAFVWVCEYVRGSLPHHDQLVVSSWRQVQPIVGPAHAVHTSCRDKHSG